MLQHATHSSPPRLPGIVLPPLPQPSAWGCTSEEVCPGELFFRDLLISKLDGQEKPPMALLNHLTPGIVIKRDRWESMEEGLKDEVAPSSGPLTVSAGHTALQASSPPTQKGSSSAVTKVPRTPGDEPPSGPRSLSLRQPWLCSGSTGSPGKDSQVQGITSFFFISPVKIIMNTKNFSPFDQTN